MLDELEKVETPELTITLTAVTISHMCNVNVGEAINILGLFSDEIENEVIERLDEIVFTAIHAAQQERDSQIINRRKTFKVV